MYTKLKEIMQLIGRGLFLEPGAYDEAAESDNAFVDGLFLVVVIGVLVAVAGAIGQVIDWAITPDLSAIKQIVYDGLLQLPVFEAMRENALAFDQFKQNYDFGWQIAETMAPSLGTIVSGLILGPLGLVIAWLWFALVAQGVARLLGGNGSLQETLGASALAAAPALLNIFGILPSITVAAVGVWTLLARYVAIRRVHENLTWGRSVVAVVSPMVLSWLLLMLLGGLLAVTMGAFIGGLVS